MIDSDKVSVVGDVHTAGSPHHLEVADAHAIAGIHTVGGDVEAVPTVAVDNRVVHTCAHDLDRLGQRDRTCVRTRINVDGVTSTCHIHTTLDGASSVDIDGVWYEAHQTETSCIHTVTHLAGDGKGVRHDCAIECSACSGIELSVCCISATRIPQHH